MGFDTLETERDPVQLPVTGTLPTWLSGTLLRNGPARFEANGRSLRHWFDGQSMLHRFTLHDGTVTYTNRYLDTASNRALTERGRISFAEFATDPCASLFLRFFTRFRRKPTPNATVNIMRDGDRLLALGETPMPVEFDPDTLATAGVSTYADDLDGMMTTAHPHQHPGTGDLVNYLLRFSRTSEYRVYRQAPGSARRELVTAYPAERPAYMHSFAVTERFAVLVEYPLVVNPLEMVLRGKPFIENYRWKPERGTRFVVLDLKDGSVRAECTGAPMFAFHHINAYEDGEDVVVDLCAYEDAGVVDALYLKPLREGGALPLSYPVRCRIGLRTGEVRQDRLSDEPMELPRIDYARHNGRPYRVAYATGSRAAGEVGEVVAGDFTNQLVKLDVRDGTTRTWFAEGTYPGEPLFVPAPGSADEDDGVVLSVVLDAATASSFLLVLDAASFTEVARAEVPHAIPFGFHGIFARSR